MFSVFFDLLGLNPLVLLPALFLCRKVRCGKSREGVTLEVLKNQRVLVRQEKTCNGESEFEKESKEGTLG